MARPVLADANVLMDVLSGDPTWLNWSFSQLAAARRTSRVVVNQIVCAEIAPYFGLDWQKLDRWLKPGSFHREALPFESSVVAARAYQQYRARGGTRTSPLPDFYIGAHAEAAGYSLLTRDVPRYRTYFPTVHLIVPPGF
jgi:predicted nucleic acid-binding protein